MMDGDDSEYLIRKTSEDKLTYKNTIQRRIDWCLIVMGSTQFPSAVKALERAIIFDIKGYKFKTEIGKIHDEVKDKSIQREEEQKIKLGRQFYKRANQAKFKIRQQEQFWLDIYDSLLQLIADHNLLVDTEKTLPVKKVGENDSEKEE